MTYILPNLCVYMHTTVHCDYVKKKNKRKKIFMLNALLNVCCLPYQTTSTSRHDFAGMERCVMHKMDKFEFYINALLFCCNLRSK